MHSRTITYWTTTALLAVALLAGGVFDLSRAPEVLGTLTHLGFPAYVATLLGGWKILGALAILAPGAARLKEWAYAGVVFDLSGAVVSHASVGDSVAQFAAPLALLALAAASWALRPASRVLPSRDVAPSPARSISDAQPSLA